MKIDSVKFGGNFPDFLVVGAAKSGTSSLHNYLKQHPGIFLPADKELLFWHQNRNKNKAIFNYWPRERVPANLSEYLLRYEKAAANQLCGEVCPSYLYYHEETIESLKELHPKWEDVKIIIILRNPTDRILSEYRFVRQNGLDPDDLDLKTALLQESRRKQNPDLLLDLFYRSLSSYHDQVLAYYKVFPEVFVCLFDDLRDNSVSILSEVFEFLGVDSNTRVDTESIFNASKPVKVERNILARTLYRSTRAIWNALPLRLRRSKFKQSGFRIASKVLHKPEVLPAELANSLRFEFNPEIEKLETLIKRDLSTWKQS